MLQQTQVPTVIPYYRKWLRRFPDFGAVARASQQEVLQAWQGLGYYARARNLHRTARLIVHRYGGRFPRSVDQMQQLPGIGKYSAHAVATFSFDQSLPIVEANTARVLTRVFDFREPIDSNPARKTLWDHAASLVPKYEARTFNSALVDLGALVCVPRNPRCDACPVERLCRAKNPGTLPINKPNPRTKRLVERHAFVLNKNRILLQQSATRWRGMWVLPQLDARVRGRPDHRSTFPFTHHQITLVVYCQRPPERILPGQRWFRSIGPVAMPSPHRRAAEALIRKFPLNARQGALSRRQQWLES
jgi:A/G-specific adenine glycosylase